MIIEFDGLTLPVKIYNWRVYFVIPLNKGILNPNTATPSDFHLNVGLKKKIVWLREGRFGYRLLGWKEEIETLRLV